ncbi:unnamed protein product [Calypogeia fissa]
MDNDGPTTVQYHSKVLRAHCLSILPFFLSFFLSFFDHSALCGKQVNSFCQFHRSRFDFERWECFLDDKIGPDPARHSIRALYTGKASGIRVDRAGAEIENDLGGQ